MTTKETAAAGVEKLLEDLLRSSRGDGYKIEAVRSYIESLEAKLKIAREALEVLAAQDSGEVGSTKKSDCMATIAQLALSQLSL